MPWHCCYRETQIEEARAAQCRRRTTYVPISGFRVLSSGKREKSRSAVHNSLTPLAIQIAAIRASWTATTGALGTHVEAFCEVLEHAAGLPPTGVTDLSSRSRA